MIRRRHGLVAVAVTTLHWACATLPPQPAAPGRPTFSSDTGTTAVGTIEVEAGLAVSSEYRDGTVALKWGATERAELFVEILPYVRDRIRGSELDGFGDLAVGTRVRFLEEKGPRPSAAYQLFAKLPTADHQRGLGTGEVDVFGAGTLTKTLDRTTLVGFYQLGVLGGASPGEVDVEHGFAVAGAYPVVQNLSGFAEIAAVFVPTLDLEIVFTTLGVGYDVSPSFVLDAAANLGLTADAPRSRGTVGLTWNLGSIAR